jgi:hypothetical protein
VYHYSGFDWFVYDGSCKPPPNTTHVWVVEGLTTLDEYHFDGIHQTLRKVRFPTTLTIIGESLFSSFKCLGMPDGCVDLSNTKVRVIGKHAFVACMGMTSIKLPITLVRLDPCSFHRSGLVSVTLPPNVTTIGNSSFCECPDLVEVILPDSRIRIVHSAFRGSRLLRRVRIPDTATHIGDECFKGCHELTDISDLSKFTNVHARAFFKCEALGNLARKAGFDKSDIEGFLKQRYARRESRKRIFAVLMALRRVSDAVDSTAGGIGSMDEVSIVGTMEPLGKHTYLSYTTGGGMDVWRKILSYVKE